MRHGAVEYFDPDGRPLAAPEDVALTAEGIDQARAAGAALAAAGVRIDRVVTSGLARTRDTAAAVLAAAALAPPVEHWPALQEIRGGRLAAIPDANLKAAFVGAFEGPVPREVRFLNGESIGALIDRVLPALHQLLAATDWDTALMVAHGGVNRALLSWFLTGEPVFLGGLAQDPGCLNIVDVGANPATSVLRVINFCPATPLHTDSRHTTMEHLLMQYLRARSPQAAATGETR